MENTNVKKELTDVEQKAYELEKEFSYDGYQVVRKELFAHLRDPAIVIRPDGISFNTACINGLPETVYINIMVNPDKRHMIVVKSSEDKKLTEAELLNINFRDLYILKTELLMLFNYINEDRK